MSVNVLVWGHVDNGACAYFRGYMYDEPLRDLGINIRHISKLDGTASITLPDGSLAPLEGLNEAQVMARVQRGEWKLNYDLDTGPIEWADVVMFRRYYNTALKCRQPACGYLTPDVSEAEAHGQATGHQVGRQDDITRTMWPAISGRTDKAVLYETDDLHIGHGIQKWNGYWIDVQHEKDLITEMTRRADLVTVSTPMLTRTYGRYNDNIRVVRNAIDPSLYTTDRERPDTLPRLLYYGSTARLRDYAGRFATGDKKDGPGYAYLAVEELKREMHRIFIGTNPGTEEIIEVLFDEHYHYLEDIPAFCRQMADTRSEIGLAPLGGDPFDQNKSELHWLEYAMAGAATVAHRFPGGPDEGPYNMIRDGVDGFLARGRQDWYDGVRRLVREPNLRADMAAAAKERVLRDYDFRKRAEEWADAFRWASEHRGIGATRKAA